MKRFECAVAIGLVVSILITSFSGFAKECDDIRQEVVRLHILANSDSDTDQELKLSVRDAVLAGTSQLFTQSENRLQAETLAAGELDDIRRIAQEEIQRQGYDYDVSVRIINRYFNTRQYDNFTMPAGRYDAVQLEIGEGAGKNWWCVMFPPMCVPAASEQSATPLEDQILELGQSPRYVPAFAVVEAIEAIQDRLDPPGTPEIELQVLEATP